MLLMLRQLFKIVLSCHLSASDLTQHDEGNRERAQAGRWTECVYKQRRILSESKSHSTLRVFPLMIPTSAAEISCWTTWTLLGSNSGDERVY